MRAVTQGRGASSFVLGAAALLLAGCGGPGAEGTACTLLGAEPGVQVTVAPALASRGVDEVALRVCADETCTDAGLSHAAGTLREGTRSVDQGCTGDTCSATSTPDGTLRGFAPTELPRTAVEVTTTARAGGRTVRTQTRTVTPELTYPNGRQCPAGARQVAVTMGG